MSNRLWHNQQQWQAQEQRAGTDDFALVKCSRCGEFVRVPWELLGDTRPEDVVDYICGACEDDDWYDGYEDDWDDDPLDHTMYPLELDE